ncbi:MAG: small multi-drug export protein [Patescibacteria group bacterium]
MKELIIQALEVAPPWLRVIALSAIPITEYQLSIPVGIHEYHLAPWWVFVLGVIGAAVPFFPLYFGLEWLREFLVKHFPPLLRPLDVLLARAERKLKDDYAKYGMMALFLLLVIPFPLTGVWTASFAAVALKIPFKEAALGILLGMLGGATVVVILSVAGGAVL